MANPIYTFTRAGRSYTLVHDELYHTRGSYALDTEEETKAAEDEEITKLNSGEWIVLGCIVREPCPENRHCQGCYGSHETDALWGIVIANSTAVWEREIPELMG